MTSRQVSKSRNAASSGANKPSRESLADPIQVGEYLDRSVEVLANWRYQGVGPKFIRVGRRIRYRWADVDAWLESNTVEQTG